MNTRSGPSQIVVTAEQLWHPVASWEDVPQHHVCWAKLLGRELAVWRADDGYLNVWENRCLHRGVRLTIGTNDGRELVCRYHGWRYASRTAGCTYIPAHPADAPARTICNRTFGACERYGLVWSGADPVGAPPEITALEQQEAFGLRGLPVHAPVDLVLERLSRHRFLPTAVIAGTAREPDADTGFDIDIKTDTDIDTDTHSDADIDVVGIEGTAREPDTGTGIDVHIDTSTDPNAGIDTDTGTGIDTGNDISINADIDIDTDTHINADIDIAEVVMTVEERSDYHIVLRADAPESGASSTVVFFVQPTDADRSVIRPVLAGTPPPDSQMPVWRHHNTVLSALRVAVEAEAASMPTPEPLVAAIEQVPIHLSELPEPALGSGGRHASLRVRVARKWQIADDVAGFELVSIADQLPTFQPGAHVDVHLPNGLVRQYSLTNGPGELDHYTIGVKLEPNGEGGSAALHNDVREGDVLAISEPRNNFPLRRDALRTVLVAGGIGITPLLSMARALHHQGLTFELHVFARSQAHLAFGDILSGLGDAVTRHIGLSPQQTGAALEALLADPGPHEHVYICGPGPMLDAARSAAVDAGRPDETVHFEYFSNPTEIDDSVTFSIDLARSALTLDVSAGRTIMEVLRSNGVEVASSCETGACGTCRVAVLDGEPLHNDVYLNNSEKQRGDQMMVCVSRARSDRLVLDI